MQPRILLVNPPIYDFSAYDFWLKPYGLLSVAGMLRGRAGLRLFDYLDRLHPLSGAESLRRDAWGRGEFYSEIIPRPAALGGIPRNFRRFGLPRRCFQEFLEREGPFDVALVQTVMTYWYPGVREVIDDLRAACPRTLIVLGGVYATLCPQHAGGLGADLVVQGSALEPLWDMLNIAPDLDQPPFWEGYPALDVGVLKITRGCPFRCTYCSVPQMYPQYAVKPLSRSLAELDALTARGVRQVAFYDDALLHRPEEGVLPFLAALRERKLSLNLHTPNAVNARFLTPELARAMVQAGFRTFYLGFESVAADWQGQTGGKVGGDDLAGAVENLLASGAERRNITAYLIIAHPLADGQAVEPSMRFAHSLGIRVMLSEFSPIPGTPDGERCGRLVDLSEPLWHNKTAFAIASLGAGEVDRLKQLSRRLNQERDNCEL